ncbi:LacI family DNA-binding transcriptional regulator [Leifsonia sp. NPDC080035]|uniref:LacI family DNA-binding transcriptional regulator n=1 Tax=Leifsonia sp. NPDC080035 TaxID=3143936 RepID=A0AAU7GG14_9MICO
MAPSRAPRITQRTIAELAGVSQATVSLVLNGRSDNGVRIPEETRERVLAVIRQTTYVADPVARSLAGSANNLVGVFTYEHAFPNETSDFYTPLLTGIESEAETRGLDLLMFTSAPLVDGRRRIFHENSRLRLADGCLLLGREMDADELARLRDSGYPFVAIGRRDVEGVAFVGVDYATPTRQLARMAVAAGHHSAFYARLSLSLTAESSRDRHDALIDELTSAGVAVDQAETTEAGLASVWRRVREGEATVLFVEDPTDAEGLHALAAADGVAVPDDLSFVVLGEHGRGGGDVDFTRLSAPRTELGSRAVVLLDQLLNGTRGQEELPVQQLLECTVIDGSTLAAPRAGAAR